MIIVKITGGIGNQMFQYAAARRLADIHSELIKLDITSYESNKLRRFELDHFDIKADIANKKEIEKFVRIPNNIFEKILFNFIPSMQKRNKFYYKERFYHFDPDFLNLPDDVYLSGYWQSEKYFSDIEEIIRDELTIKSVPNKRNQELLRQIESINSISIHVRRGDFAEDSSTLKLHGLYDTDYFHRAISLISAKIQDPHYFIFSNDNSWAKSKLKIKFPTTFIDFNTGKNDYEDIRLMSSCQNNIIVNSTFGWWGAWLNNNESKIVISPKDWFKNGPVDTYDLLPKSWITI